MRLPLMVVFALSASVSIISSAEQQCSSAWVFQRYNTFIQKPNLNAPGTETTFVHEEGKIKGGPGSGEAMCKIGVDRFNSNQENAAKGQIATRADLVGEGIPHDQPLTMYSYNCRFHVTQYPMEKVPDPNGSAEDRYSYDNTHTYSDLRTLGNPICLSCDPVAATAGYPALAACLKRNIETIIEAKDASTRPDLRPDDLKAVFKRVNQVLARNKQASFLSVDAEDSLTDWSTKTASSLGLSQTQSGPEQSQSAPIVPSQQ